MSFDAVAVLAKEKYPKKFEGIVKYGTAGFRTKAEILDFVMFRMGLLAAVRSCHKKAAIGVIITASHNPAEDNGVKLVDPFGEMLSIDWEDYATSLANCIDSKVPQVLQSIINKNNVDMSTKPLVFVGRDTRPSSEMLQKAVMDGAESLGAIIKDFAVVSTPVIHFVVACINYGGRYGLPSEEGYLKKLTSAFVALRRMTTVPKKSRYNSSIFFDGANGVGALMMAKMQPLLENELHIQIFNAGDGVLNYMCGADYVKTAQSWPNGVPKQKLVRCASMDGDADRLMYSYLDADNRFVMLDGDKIATLVAGYLKSLIDRAAVNLKLGLVQTAYANGASTKYIEKELGVPVACAKTGVKFLHEEALQYDVGVYFEANGHGTIIFSEKAKAAILCKAQEHGNAAAEELVCAMNLINETVGDAISDMFLVETVLCVNDWSEQDWNNAYTDLPNRLMKVTVKDRTAVTTTNAERTCVTPIGLQDKIDDIVKQYADSRAFVRPSGTEDIVRIYAESATREDTDKLACEIANCVYELAAGVGVKPTVS